MSDRRPVVECQRKLLLLWTVLGAIAMVVVMVQTGPGGAYQANAADLWDWFLPTIVPAVSLMMGSVVAEARNTATDATADSFAFKIAVVVSVIYLLVVIALLMMYAQSPHPIADLRGSNKLVTTLYALVGIALGAFFVSRKAASNS